jgi:hypothetical protein
MELFGHIVDGRCRNVSARSRKVAFELEKLEGGGDSKVTAGLAGWEEFELV